MNKDEFVHLHVHSEYSNIRLLDSINKIKNMILYANELGQSGLALTDHECLSGHVKFIKAIKELKKEDKILADFKGILGNEIYLVDEEEMNKEILEWKSNFYHFLLLAKNKEGHKQLRQLSSRAWERMFTYKGMDRVPTFYTDIEEVVGGNSKKNLIATTACLGGFLGKNVLNILFNEEADTDQCKKNIHRFINWCIKIFSRDNFYIELQPSDSVEQIEYNKYVLNIAKAYSLKHIIATDAHYLKREDREIHKAYLTSDEDEGGDREVDGFYGSTHFFSSEELYDSMNYLSEEIIKEGILNTFEIKEQIEEYDLFHEQVIPKIKLSEENGWFNDYVLRERACKYEWINELAKSEEKYDRYLFSLILKGIKDKIHEDDFEESFERINVECKEILKTSEAKHQPISSYFITMAKNIDIIWEEAESIVGPGRGSAGGFLINELIEVTQVNPLKQGVYMPHWRFITAERPDYPIYIGK